MMDRGPWESLTIESRVVPPRLSDARFRDWMAGRPVFVSSVMDAEMAPSRRAVRDWLRSWGGDPVMWEELTPRDEQARHAYLDGVDRSAVFVLLLGTSYGVSDESGFSPTHHEGNRAAERWMSRLVFQLGGVSDADRDGKLNRWIRSLHNEVSSARYADGAELVRLLEDRLREIAGAQETPWVKLGDIVFPGHVRQQTVAGETRLTVTATVRDRGVRDALSALSGWHRHGSADRLTWGTVTVPIEVEETEIDSQALSSDAVRVVCRRDGRRTDTGEMGWGGMSFVDPQGRTIGPPEQVVMWAGQALFDDPLPGRDEIMSGRGLTAPSGPTLPTVLAREGARGWLAEGLIRLYLVEGMTRKFGGRFEQIEVGPATATGVRVSARFRPAGSEQGPASIDGVVTLP